MGRITLQDISDILEPLSWKCHESKYKNLDTEMSFECPEGHSVLTTWKKLRNKQDCPICKQNKTKQIVNISAKKKEKGVYRILALDQSSKINGYSIYDDGELISYGTFIASKEKQLDRIVDICEWLDNMIVNWQPDEIGIEDIQYQGYAQYKQSANKSSDVVTNHDNFKLLGQVMGAIIITTRRHNIPIKIVNISKWRGHNKVKGNKRADQKRSAQLIIKKRYDISVTDDESDAICIGQYFVDKHKESENILGIWLE